MSTITSEDLHIHKLEILKLSLRDGASIVHNGSWNKDQDAYSIKSDRSTLVFGNFSLCIY